VADGRECRTLTQTPAGADEPLYISAPALHHDGRLLAVGLDTGFGLWDAATGSPLALLPCYSPVNGVLFEPSGALLTAGRAGLFRWPVRADPAEPTRLRVGPPQRLPSPPAAMRLAQSRDGNVLAVVNRAIVGFHPHEGGWILRRDRAGTPLRIDERADLADVAVSPDGRWVATVNHQKGIIKVWDARDGHLEKTLAEWGGLWPRFSRDGRWLSTGADGGRLYAVGTWAPGPRLGGYGGDFSPDGKLVALATEGPPRLVDAVTGRACATLAGPLREAVRYPTFSPDGTRLMGIIRRGVVVWDLRAVRRELAELGLDWEPPAYPPAQEAAARRTRLSVTALARHPFSQADSLVAAAHRHQKGHNYGEALQALREAVRCDPGHAQAHNNLAWLLLTAPEGLRDPAAALPLARRAVELASSAEGYHNTLGVALYRTGDFRGAVTSLERSLKDSAGRMDAFDLFFLTMCHQCLGEKAKARDCFDRATRWMAERAARLPLGWQEELRTFRREAEAVLAGQAK
jgi:Tfp pilus assembly protein PilF